MKRMLVLALMSLAPCAWGTPDAYHTFGSTSVDSVHYGDGASLTGVSVATVPTSGLNLSTVTTAIDLVQSNLNGHWMSHSTHGAR
mgnify:CR=1 FL=1